MQSDLSTRSSALPLWTLPSPESFMLHVYQWSVVHWYIALPTKDLLIRYVGFQVIACCFFDPVSQSPHVQFSSQNCPPVPPAATSS